MSSAPGRALIVKLSSIGDVIHAMPSYMALRAAWPTTEFGWAVESAAADLVRVLPGPLTVHELDIQRWRGGLWRPRTIGAARQALAGLRARRYELALDFQGLLKSAVVARIATSRVLGFARADLREPLAARLYSAQATRVPTDIHIIRHNLHLAASAGAEVGEPEFPLLASPADRKSVRATLASMGVEQYVVMHSAANWSSKRYPEQRLVETARELHSRTGLDVVWVWGPGEQQEVTRRVELAGRGNVAAPGLRLPELAALIAEARLFVGGDSAPLHLADAAGTPAVALFGPTDPRRLGPTRPADAVVCRRLDCSHCHKRTCPLGTNECLEAIPASEVVSAALGRLGPAHHLGRAT